MNKTSKQTTSKQAKTVKQRRDELFAKKVKLERKRELESQHVKDALDELLKPSHCEVTMYGITRSFDIAKDGWINTCLKWVKSQIKDESYKLDPTETITQRFREAYKVSSTTTVTKLQVGKPFVHARFITRG